MSYLDLIPQELIIIVATKINHIVAFDNLRWFSFNLANIFINDNVFKKLFRDKYPDVYLVMEESGGLEYDFSSQSWGDRYLYMLENLKMLKAGIEPGAYISGRLAYNAYFLSKLKAEYNTIYHLIKDIRLTCRGYSNTIFDTNWYDVYSHIKSRPRITSSSASGRSLGGVLFMLLQYARDNIRLNEDKNFKGILTHLVDAMYYNYDIYDKFMKMYNPTQETLIRSIHNLKDMDMYQEFNTYMSFQNYKDITDMIIADFEQRLQK